MTEESIYNITINGVEFKDVVFRIKGKRLVIFSLEKKRVLVVPVKIVYVGEKKK